MSKDTTTVQGMDNITPGYLKGKIDNNETLVGETLYNDIMQFFQKLLDLAGLAANGDYDNEINGYQFVDALIAKIRATAATTVLKGTVEKATTAEAQAGTAEKFLDAALLQLVTATETRKGVVEKATSSEVNAGTADKFIDAALLLGLTAGRVLKEIPIGDWDMNTTLVLGIAHGLTATQAKTIMVIGANIRDDADTTTSNPFISVSVTSVGGNAAHVGTITSTLINLAVTVGSLYNTSDTYNGTGFSRGNLLIAYKP